MKYYKMILIEKVYFSEWSWEINLDFCVILHQSHNPLQLRLIQLNISSWKKIFQKRPITMQIFKFRQSAITAHKYLTFQIFLSFFIKQLLIKRYRRSFDSHFLAS